MSSTNRGYIRHISDFYQTEPKIIKNFWNEFLTFEGENIEYDCKILDPCAGGTVKYPAPYPLILKQYSSDYQIATMDIRENTESDIIGNFLDLDIFELGFTPELIITNPPFNTAQEIINKSLEIVMPYGFVIMLLRLNFLGSDSRKSFFKNFMPKYVFVHSNRPSFFPEDFYVFDKNNNPVIDPKTGKQKVYKKGATDSTEYAHFVWQEGVYNNFSKTIII